MRMLVERTVDCRACDLGFLGLPRCVGYGPVVAEVAVVGINPSVRAVDGETAFRVADFVRVGERAAGLRLTGALRAFWHLSRLSGLELSLAYVTNAVKCATPGNRVPTAEEIEACLRSHLTLEMSSLGNLRRVLVLGRIVGAHLGLSDFGCHRTLDGTLAEATLLRHPVATLRRWTRLPVEAAAWRSALGRPS